MEFRVYFTTNRKDKALMSKMGEPGIDMLDYIRETWPEIKDVESKRLNVGQTCPISGHLHSILITETLARNSGLFAGRTSVMVNVPEGAFDRFLNWHKNESYGTRQIKPAVMFCGFKLKKAVEEDYIYRVDIGTSVSEEEVLEAWADDGFPTRWLFPKEKAAGDVNF